MSLGASPSPVTVIEFVGDCRPSERRLLAERGRSDRGRTLPSSEIGTLGVSYALSSRSGKKPFLFQTSLPPRAGLTRALTSAGPPPPTPLITPPSFLFGTVLLCSFFRLPLSPLRLRVEKKDLYYTSLFSLNNQPILSPLSRIVLL